MDTTKTTKKEAPRAADFRMRSGAVSISIWRRESDRGIAFSCRLQKSWRDQEGQWVTTETFSDDDLLDFGFLVQEAKRWCAATRTEYYGSQSTQEVND